MSITLQVQILLESVGAGRGGKPCLDLYHKEPRANREGKGRGADGGSIPAWKACELARRRRGGSPRRLTT